MSNTSSEISSTCAYCGKVEEVGSNLKTCTACEMVKYCSRDCQIAHRPQHKKACKKRAAELHDEKLFKQPPPLEDCPICMQRLPLLESGQTYMNCCGKMICSGCVYAPVYDDKGNQVDNEKCPFCRTPNPSTDDEILKRYEKRMELNDAKAIYNMGCQYKNGRLGLPRDHAKALELWHRAVELGFDSAYYNIGSAYLNGETVEMDMKKAVYYYELAAMKGCPFSRHNLGACEARCFNYDRSLKHYMIAVRDGNLGSLEMIKRMYKGGYATKDDYAKALRSYQAYVGEIKSDQRDKAATSKDNKYYGSTGF